MQGLEEAVRSYLHDVLGLPVRWMGGWARSEELPYFLQSAFHFSELELSGQSVVLAIAQSRQQVSPSEIRKWFDKVRTLSQGPVVFVVETMASYERKRLIEQKVPFIVPGNQLYLPDLGLDLREYFRRRTPTSDGGLSPSAQALLITALLRQPWQVEWQPSTLASTLGYTAMTVSRVVKELTAVGLATSYSVGRSRWMRMELAPQQTWERARSMLRTPVKRTVWVSGGSTAEVPLRLAGLSALARHSMLAEPTRSVYAIGHAQWKAATKAGVLELPEPMPGAHEWQVWTYNPALVPDQATVDPLSLILSMQDDTDDRIQMALDELREQLPW